MNPKAVLLADIHFSVPTLELATHAFKVALDNTKELKVPLIVAGDLLDGKAILRAEVVNRLISLVKYEDPRDIIILGGNHDLINEKGEEFALDFLNYYCEVITKPVKLQGFYFIPYQSDRDKMREILSQSPKNVPIICHQGLQGANAGHYMQDKSALSAEDIGKLRIISGHYHRRQTIGNFSYLGNPYTLTFGEANDGPKGYNILMDDDSLEFVPLKLRAHRIYEQDLNDHSGKAGYLPYGAHSPGDLIWVKIHGPQSELAQLTKKKVAESMSLLDMNFKLDLIPYQCNDNVEAQTEHLTADQVLDSLIDGMTETAEQKQALKDLWKEICAY